MARDEFSDIVEAIMMGGLGGAEKELKSQSTLRSGLQKSLITSRIKEAVKAEKATIKEKEKPLLKTEIKDTKKQLMSQFLGDLRGQASKKESRLDKLLPGRQSVFERLNSALVKRQEPYVIKNKLQIKRLFKDIGITVNDWRQWIKENYGDELDKKLFPVEEKLQLLKKGQ